ncbi:MAG: hypothetical protein RBR71_11155 [Gudongella sp.]|nr:hypothetical protein [Gudongella sp.]
MDSKIIEIYLDYANKIGNRKALYRAVAKKYNIHSAIYPGSHIDIAPSIIIPKVTYIDNFKGAISFFKNIDTIKEYIEQNKEYNDLSEIVFIGEDYTEVLGIEEVDLIISEYAGFVGQATKQYLKVGGILLCNDSHGDATLARFDKDFVFIGIVDSKNRVQNKNLDQYFILPKGKAIDFELVREKMKGLKYKIVAENYLFRKV